MQLLLLIVASALHCLPQPLLHQLRSALPLLHCFCFSTLCCLHLSIHRQLLLLGSYKLGWKNKYAAQPALYGPIFNSGIIPHGSRISLSDHKVWCAEVAEKHRHAHYQKITTLLHTK